MGKMNEMDIEKLAPWLIAVGILLAGFIAIKIIDQVLKKTLKRTAIDAALHKFIRSVTACVCWIVLIGTVLSYIGVPLSTFITMLGVAGAAIALALKDSLGNIAGGIIIMISKPFKRGDFIEASGVKGTAYSIDLLITTLTSEDGNMVYIPNGELSKSVIINYSSGANDKNEPDETGVM